MSRWPLYEMKHQKLVSLVIKGADGGTGLLHKITKPTAWRGGAQISKEEEEDVNPLARCEEKRKERATHWQCDTEVQDLKDKPWENEELKNSEEHMPRLNRK